MGIPTHSFNTDFLSARYLDPLKIRQTLGRKNWKPPIRWGSNSWRIDSKDKGQIIVSCADYGGELWIHASISRVDEMPTYEDLKLMHKACFNNGFAYQVFVPEEDHVNYHVYALHLWGRLDGTPVLPNFLQYHIDEFGDRMV